VMAVPGFGPKDRVGFFLGLMDWIGSEPPTYDALAGVDVVSQAKAHFEAIAKTGGLSLVFDRSSSTAYWRPSPAMRSVLSTGFGAGTRSWIGLRNSPSAERRNRSRVG
jgi:hypothetical protein